MSGLSLLENKSESDILILSRTLSSKIKKNKNKKKMVTYLNVDHINQCPPPVCKEREAKFHTCDLLRNGENFENPFLPMD